MSTPLVKGLNASVTGDETHILSGHEPEDVGSADSNSSSPVTYEEVARQTKAATNPLTRQLEGPCHLTKKLRQALPKRNEEISGLIQGPSRPHSSRFDSRRCVLVRIRLSQYLVFTAERSKNFTNDSIHFLERNAGDPD